MKQKVLIPKPDGDFVFWANNLANEFKTSTIPLATDVKKWREWATNLIYCNPEFINFPIPIEYHYPNDEDWKKWAAFFVNNLYTI